MEGALSELTAKIERHIVDAKDRAIAAHSEAMRMGMLRTGDPWSPIAEAIAFCGVVIADANKTRFRTWGRCGPEWTDDIFKATWYVRRDDAEAVCLTDEDGWHILSVNDVLADAVGV